MRLLPVTRWAVTDPIFADCTTSDDGDITGMFATPAEPHAGTATTATTATAAPLETWPIRRLKANSQNHELFDDSLTAEALAPLAQSLLAHGQQHPITVLSDGTIVDGERRWKAARLAGISTVQVRIEPATLTDEEMLARVLDAFSANRSASLKERVRVYQAWVRVLQQRHGRPCARPSKVSPIGETFLTPQDLHKQAAERAGFTSARQAERTEAVFTRGDVVTQMKVLAGDISVSAAYDSLPKRPRTTAADPEPTSPLADASYTEAPPATAITATTRRDGTWTAEAPLSVATSRNATGADTAPATPVHVAKPVTLAPTVVTAVPDQVRPAPAVAVLAAAHVPPAELELDDHLAALRNHLEALTDRSPEVARDLAKEWADALLAAAGWPPTGEDAYSGMNAPEEDDNCQDDIQDDEAPEPEDEAPPPRKKRHLTFEEELEQIVGRPAKR